jgi:3-deoxy-D-manno-octulosonate 8-phosphate phosphatase (KDO 8-P phosphatase)
MHNDATARAAKVKLMIFDVDGVLTDGSMNFSADGEIIKRFFVHDGLGVRLLQESGVPTAIISARQSPIVTRRAADLGIHHVHQGAYNKLVAFEQLLEQTGLTPDVCGFAGDDVIDLPVLTRVGFAVSVPNGHPEAIARAHYITQAPGGNGAVRNICDFILRAQGNYDKTVASFLS